MTTILPISDLRNYSDVLDQVDIGQPVYLTRHGRGTYVIAKIDEYDRQATREELLALIEQGEKSLQTQPVHDSLSVAKRFGVDV